MKRLWIPLTLALALAAVQQQWLQRRPPRLLAIEPAAAGSGLAAVELQFSRPMDGASLQANLQLPADQPHELLGEGNRWRLQLSGTTPISKPLTLQIAGVDQRGNALEPSQWQWEPRPALLASRPAGENEQLLSWQEATGWQKLTNLSGSVHSLLPLGNGSGAALVTATDPLEKQVQRLRLSPDLTLIDQRPLEREPVVFASLSTNNAGDLLVQRSKLQQSYAQVELWNAKGKRRQLPMTAGGPIRLVPQGGLAVVPEEDGIALQTLPPLPAKRDFLPGLRDLSSFCPQAGRAVLVRHWPDYRRSIELLEPGRAPRQLWIGTEALLSSACAGAADRIWILLLSGLAEPLLELVELNRDGEVLKRMALEGYEPEPGSQMHYDPSRRALLLLLKQRSALGASQALPQAHLFTVDTGVLQAIPGPIGHAGWLPSRQITQLRRGAPRRAANTSST